MTHYLTSDGLPPVMPTDEERAAAIALRNTPTEKIIRHARIRLFSAAGRSGELRYNHSATLEQTVDTRDRLWTAREAFKEALKERENN